ncbi:MAG: hypothetical protein AAFV53_35300 [Myxococcota bacterium]
MTESNTHTFTLQDRGGVPHTYVVTLHNPDEGFILLQRLSALGLEPIAEMVQSALPRVLPAIGEGGIESMDVSVLAQAIELSGAAQRFTAAFQRLDPLTIRQLLKLTERDGLRLIDTVEEGRVNTEFNAAYKGNYGELFAALWRVVVFNGFFPRWLTSLVDAALSAVNRAASTGLSNGLADISTGGPGAFAPADA